MRRITYMKEKLNIKSRKCVMAVIGTSCLVLATLLGISMFSFGRLDSQARGYAFVENGNTQDTFWYGFTIPNEVKIWQEMMVTPSVKSKSTSTSKKYNADYDDNIYKTEISVSYARDDKFSLNITDHKLKSSSSAWGEDLRTVDKENVWKDSSNTDCKFEWISEYATNYKVTYYRVVEQGNNVGTDWGNAMFEYYKDTYNPGEGSSRGIPYKKDPNAFVTNRDTCGREFKELADNFLKNQNGFKEYTNNYEIPMTQNEKPIAGVEMVTITARDLYYDVIRNGSSKRVDLDFMAYTTHNYVFNYGSSKPELLNPPTATTEGGYSVTTGISKDDNIILNNSHASDIAIPQYYLSDSKISDMSSISWKSYTSPIPVNGKHYLYVRSHYKDGNKPYMESSPVEYAITYMDSSSAFIQATPESGENIDVGKEIKLSQSGAADAAIFYVIDKDTAPTLTRVPYEQRQSLGLDGHSSGGKYVKLNDVVYIKVNGIWYSSNDNTLVQYKDPIVTGEDLRLKNTIKIYALIEDSGKELGQFQTIQYSYNSSEQTEAPQSTVETSAANPTTVKMGSMIGLLCNTSGSKIFYTTDGSAPVIVVDPTKGPMAGASNTEEYSDSKPIVVNEEIANYGKSFLIMAQAVNYKEIDGRYYRIYLDSPVAKFTYTVAAQTPVESVQSIPQTNADAPKEVQIGSKIQLYSNTEDVIIYYTLDGSEPAFDEKTKEPLEGTYKYAGTEGVKVEEPENSSLFTITAVAYKEGLAISDISRLVFAYPGAVSSPYANPASGAVEENTKVVLDTATEGAIIYYEIAYGNATVNEPTTSSKVFDASNPINITQNTTIKAFAVKNTVKSTVSTFNYTVSDKLNTPVPSIETGAVVASGTIVSLKADAGATIHYTLDGSDPKDPANKKVQVGDQLVINGDSGKMIMVRTYASKTGFTTSDSSTYSYTVSAYAGGIYADREDGSTVKNGDVIYLHTDMTDADIYYTIDGTAPTEDSHSGNSVTIYGEPGEQVTVMAMAVAKGSEKSTTFATFTYTIMNKLAAPTSSVPDGAIFVKESMVELKAESGKIYYTTDGSDPSTSSNLYKKSIVIDKAVTIKAMAVADDLEQSDVSTFTYGFAQQVAAPIASYASGELEMGTKVTFTSATEGATIYYRTDGKDINLARKNELEIYKEPITINQATNFKVIAVKDKMQDSNILKVGYTVKEPVVIEAVEEEGTQNYGNQSNRLQSRRSFSDTESGPSYKDVILRNASYGAIVAAEEGVLPDQVQLIVESTNVTDAVDRRVKQVISDSFGVVASYDVTLLLNGEETQPEGTIEIGLPIPVEYENAMIHIVHVQEDGNIELFETRRSGGVAYAKVDHLSVFSITAPVEFDEEASTFPWLPIAYTLAVGLTGIGIWLIYKAKKERREDGMQDV